jgi:hypothetical protein
MKKIVLAAAAAALLVPAGGASAQSGWWTPVVDRLPARQQESDAEALCRVRPDLPICDVVRDGRDRRYPRTDDRYPRTERYPRTDRDRNGNIRYEDRARRGKKGNGPPFCRDGRGHPTKGRQWCRDKGWTSSDRWLDVGWDDVILRRPDPRRRVGTLDRGGLIDVLGDVVYGRLSSRSGSNPLRGRFAADGRILQVRAGDLPVAEFLDYDRDGRVDRVVLARWR